MIRFVILPIISAVLLAAHFSRIQNDWLALLALLTPFLLLYRRRWALRVFQIFLTAGGLIWIERLLYLRRLRLAAGEPWVRLAVILAAVAFLSFVSVRLLQKKRLLDKYPDASAAGGSPAGISLAAVFLTAILLTVVHLNVQPPLLLLERFVPGAGLLEIAALAVYAGWIAERMGDPRRSPRLRKTIWTVFSLVFFSQLLLGLLGMEKFLMTGKLHLPIPAMILAGPLFRGRVGFMLILFGATTLLAGSAWCSHLCYLGSWDNLAARRRGRPENLPSWTKGGRVGIFIFILLAAWLFRVTGLSSPAATAAGILLGLIGLGIMLFHSRRKGVMIHCTVFCPIGLAADVLGKTALFRIRFQKSCNACGACRNACRYNALEAEDIQRRRVGLTCSLCGDCLSACPRSDLGYGFPGLSPGKARLVFLTLISTLHAVFLGVARI